MTVQIPVHYMPRPLFEIDRWFRRPFWFDDFPPFPFDDPFFDEHFDQIVARHLKWINETFDNFPRPYFVQPRLSTRTSSRLSNRFLDSKPFKHSELFDVNFDDLFPKISEDGKQVSLSFDLPQDVDPAKIQVSLNNNDIIVKAEDKVESPEKSSSFSFYKRVNLPVNTDFNAIKCHLDKKKITVSGPLIADYKPNVKQIPIETVNHN